MLKDFSSPKCVYMACGAQPRCLKAFLVTCVGIEVVPSLDAFFWEERKWTNGIQV